LNNIPNKKLQNLAIYFKKQQLPKAISLASQLLQKKPEPKTVATIFTLCNQAEQYDFVLHNLKKQLNQKSNILIDLQTYAGTLFFKLHQTPSNCQNDINWLRSYIEKILPLATNVAGLISTLALKMGYSTNSPRQIVDILMRQFLAPLINHLLTQEREADALALEPWAYNVYVKQSDSEQSFSEFMSLTAHEMQAAGLKMRERDNSPDYAGTKIITTELFPVAFIIHQTSTLAHISAMLSFLKGLTELDQPRIQPIIFAFSGQDPEMLSICKELNVKLISLESNDQVNTPEKIKKLKIMIATRNCQVAVWLCLSNWMQYAFAYRIAPVQIWWSMKFHSFTSPDIDGYLSRLFIGKNFHNGHWRGGFITVNQLRDESMNTSATEMRAQLPGNIILGTFGRAELINEPRFLDNIIEILRAHPSTTYLWTGREETPTIRKAFIDGGVHSQTKFIGWVNTKLYAQIIDIYLDVFSFGTGFTLVEAMAAGKPVVFLDEKRDFSVLNVIRGIIAHDCIQLTEGQLSLLNSFAATDTDDYIKITEKLIDSSSLRNESGKLFAEIAAVFENRQLSSKIYLNHIIEIVREHSIKV
jgi:hypothetical protein